MEKESDFNIHTFNFTKQTHNNMQKSSYPITGWLDFFY
nr:MAG TPA: hypothetical protein [Caudoviricetes sp.]DAL34634.1 MAG TPA_asm: hypothetical protein [Caudoviricetes sp.]